jgi:hypothetical protein
MRYGFVIALLFISSFSFGQTSFLKNAAAKLDKALTEKDTTVLKQLLHIDATYGHSNGWVQTKADVVKDVVSGKLNYTTIANSDEQWTLNKDWASLRCTSNVKYVMDGKEATVKLHVLQVWMKTGKGWQLLARQSTKI